MAILDKNEIKNKYRLKFDYHTHTVNSMMGPFPHAHGSIMQNVEAAHNEGLEELAITDHGPGHFLYGVGIDKIEKMRAEIAEAQARFPDVKVLLGVEANFKDTPNGLDVSPEQFALYDFVNAGYHYGVKKSGMVQNWLYNRKLLPKSKIEVLRKFNTELVLRALRNNDILIITHPGDKGPFDMKAICEACEETDTIMEINARHKHLTVDEIKYAAGYKLRFVIGSDAHKPEFIGRYVASIARALEAGLDISRIINVIER